MSLHPLLGHAGVRGILADAHARASLPSALLIHGARGVGKQRLALWLAQLLVCERPAAEPCDACAPCKMARSLEHPDVHWYFPLKRPERVQGDRLTEALEDARQQALAERRADALRASYSSEMLALYVGTVRNIRSRAYKRPSIAAGPVFIVGEAELLVPQEASQEAANALLKLLEEPPGSARFVLTSSEPGLLLSTIRSRTVPLHVGALPDSDVTDFLEAHRDVAPAEAAWAARLGRGSIGRALGFLPDGDGVSALERLRREALEIVEAAAAPTGSGGYRVALRLPPARARTKLELFSFVEEWLRDLAAVALGADEAVFNADLLDRLKRTVSGSGIEAVDVPLAFAKVERARELAKGNVNPQLIVSGLARDLRAALLRGAPATAAVR